MPALVGGVGAGAPTLDALDELLELLESSLDALERSKSMRRRRSLRQLSPAEIKILVAEIKIFARRK